MGRIILEIPQVKESYINVDFHLYDYKSKDHYHLRKKLLRNVFGKMDCDIIGLQEISFSEYNQLNDLGNKKKLY